MKRASLLGLSLLMLLVLSLPALADEISDQLEPRASSSTTTAR